jgi:endonuclease/exonuclease/phosphatase (EEP) superfamily protein YafD
VCGATLIVLHAARFARQHPPISTPASSFAIRVLRFIGDRVAGALRAWMIVGILLKVTRIRDRFDWLSLVYYSTPWPALALGFALLALHHWHRGKGHPMRRYIAFTAVALFTWMALSWYSTPPASAARTLRLVQWNVARPEDRLGPCAQWIRTRNPDIICLSEPQPEEYSTLDRWLAEFPGYVARGGPAGMLCLVRGEVLDYTGGNLGPSSYYYTHHLRIRGRAVTIFQVDVIAQPTRSRRVQLARLAELANADPTGEFIIVGDFNTPRESWHLDPLRGKFTHAFEAAGHGLAETWPIFAPALSLDQVWLGRSWRAISCTEGWPPLSDHRPVVVDIAATGN